MKKKHLLLIFINIFCCNYLFAQTWTGATNTDWNTASNWSPAAVPISNGNVIIPGSLANYPLLASNVTINSINMQAGSKLDFNGHTLDILSVNSYNYFIGASLNNSNAITDIVINLNTGGGGYSSYLRSMTTNDNITFNLSGVNTFFDADGGGTANTYNGNVTFNISSSLTFYLSHGAASQYKGDLTINRTIAGGPSTLFNAGGNVSGNFKITNNLDGAVVLGNLPYITDITGKVDITVNQGSPDLFHLYNIKNHSTGGVINVQNSSGFDVEKDTLKVTSVSITGYRGSNYGYFLNNDITGNLTLVDDASYTGGYATYLRSNLITGISNFTTKGFNTFWEADNGGSGNHFTGDVSYTITNTAILYISHGATSSYDGNLSISRPGAGPTVAFNSGGIIGGNFSFTNNTAGNTTLGNNATLTSVGGMVNIAINDTLPGYCQFYRIINQTVGGNINVQNSYGFDVEKDTLKVNSITFAGYRGNNYGYFLNNDIRGNLTLADDATYAGGYNTTLRSNLISGTSNFTSNGTNTFWEADAGGTENHFTGDVSYTVTGTATLYISHGATSSYGGNLSISRPGAGPTVAFNSGGIIGGNFSFTNNTAGNTTLGNTTTLTSIGGMVNITINDTIPGYFQFYRIKNQTAGGTITAQNTFGFDVQKDTLKVISLSLGGYRGNNYGYFFNNYISGNLAVGDDASFSTGYATNLRSNFISGTSNFTSKGANTFFEADAGGTGNHFTGDVNYSVTGTATLYISHGATSSYDGNLSISRPGAGVTVAFNSGGIIGGNFSFTNNTAGNTTLGNTATPTSVGGMVNIAINNTIPGYFQFYRIINQTAGGNINVQNTFGFDVQRDTLTVNSLSLTGYRGNNYGYFFNNVITGNLVVADDASFSTGYATNIRSNNIMGNATFTKNGTNAYYDADNGGTGNSYTGNVTYNKNATGPMNVGSADTTSIGGNLTLNNASIALNLIQFTGNNDGIVQQAGTTPIIIPTLIMNKGGKNKITLMDSVVVTNNLNLNSGIIASGVNSNLVLPVNMTYLGGSDSSYVDGPMLKIGNNAFTFPLGQKNAYAPVTITAPGNVTDQFRAQYIHNNPGNDGYDSTQKDASLNHLSRLEYWLLDRTAGTSNVSVTIGWAPNRSGIVNDIPSLRVAHWNGTKWNDLGHGTTTGTKAMGTIQTAAVVTSFSPFTLASTSALNPLPINISSFSALRQSTSVFLNWSTENEINFSHFEVERSGSDNNFSFIGQVAAHNIATLQNYILEDKSPLKGINLYRLKLIDRDGKVMYSKVVSVIYNDRSAITIYPNPAHDYIQVDGVKEEMAIEINDASGKLVKRFISNASNRYQVSELHKGMYFIKIQDKENTTVSKLVIE